MKSLRITLQNMKKRKSMAVTMMILISLTTLFLSLGVNIMAETMQMFDKNRIRLQESQNVYVINNSDYNPNQLQFLEADPRVEKVEQSNGIGLRMVKQKLNNTELSLSVLFCDKDTSTGFSTPHITEKIEVDPMKAVYMPVAMKSYQVQMGDTFSFTEKGVTYSYTVAGFFETTNFGIANAGTFRYYLPEEAYQSLKTQLGEDYVYELTCKDAKDTTSVDQDFYQFLRENRNTNKSIELNSYCEYVTNKSSYNYVGTLIGAILMGFSIIIAIISILVIRFRVDCNMEDHITQIGVLGALGYTGKEIIWVYALEYILTSVVGVLLGLCGTYLLLPMVGNIIANMSGYQWMAGGHLKNDVLCLVVILTIVMVMCYTTAYKIHKYPPVIALAGGLQSHNFKKNYFALEKGKSLSASLTGKEVFSHAKQNIMIACCMAGIMYISLFGIYQYITFGVDLTGMKQVSGWEWAEINMMVEPGANEDEIAKEVSTIPGVRKVNKQSDMIQLFMDDKKVFLTAYEDMTALETVTLCEGRLPEYDNEVVITGALANAIGKRIGDSVMLEYNGYTFPYLITGLDQTFSNSGMMIKLSKDGFKKLIPNGKLNTILVYLDKNTDSQDMIEKLSERFGVSAREASDGQDKTLLSKEEQIKALADEKISKLLQNYNVDSVDYSVLVNGVMISGNTRKYIISDISDFEGTMMAQIMNLVLAFKELTIIVLIVSAIVISLMISMIVRSVMNKKKMQFGIMKALGYTTGQLCGQISMGIFIPAVVGVIIGGILVVTTIGTVTTMMMGGIGITKMSYQISALVPVGLGILLLAYVFIMSWLNAGRVRKISPYELMTD